MKIGIFSDLHIKDKDIEELHLITDEIFSIFKSHNVEEIWCLGDSFHKTNPSPKEVDFLASFLKKFESKFIRIVVAKSHESKSPEESTLNHFGILTDNIQIAPEYDLKTLEGQKIYLGHFMVKESLCGFKEIKTVKDYSNYDYAFLGHQHSYQAITNKIYHIGSCRYINFDEVKDCNKYIAIFDTCKSSNQLQLIELQSIYPMITLKDVDFCSTSPKIEEKQPKKRKRGRPPKKQKRLKLEGESASSSSTNNNISELIETLDKLDPKTKVRVIFYNFNNFQKYINLEKNYANKFYVYKRETKFNIIDSTIEASKKETLSMKEYFINWIKEKNIEKGIANIILKELALAMDGLK